MRRSYPYPKGPATWSALISRAQAARLDHPGLLVQFQLEGHHDEANMLEWLPDRIQDSGLVLNDRHIAALFVAPTLKDPRGAQDEAWLCFWESQR